MTTYLPNWLRNNFQKAPIKYHHGKLNYTPSESSLVKNADMVKHLLVLLRRRGPDSGVRFRYVPGHRGYEGNEAADRLAKIGAEMPALPDRTDWLDPETEEVEEASEPVNIDFEIDEDMLMTQDELDDLEKATRTEDIP